MKNLSAVTHLYPRLRGTSRLKAGLMTAAALAVTIAASACGPSTVPTGTPTPTALETYLIRAQAFSKVHSKTLDELASMISHLDSEAEAKAMYGVGSLSGYLRINPATASADELVQALLGLHRFRCLDIERSRAGPEWCTKIRSVTQNSASREASSKLVKARAKGRGRRADEMQCTIVFSILLPKGVQTSEIEPTGASVAGI